jgi:hypothetical protein
MADSLKVIRYRGISAVAFGALSDYRPLVSDDFDELPVRTGIQTCRAGYQTKARWHPYVEILHVLGAQSRHGSGGMKNRW